MSDYLLSDFLVDIFPVKPEYCIPGLTLGPCILIRVFHNNELNVKFRGEHFQLILTFLSIENLPSVELQNFDYRKYDPIFPQKYQYDHLVGVFRIFFFENSKNKITNIPEKLEFL